MADTINIHFLGGAGTVTGSKYLLELEGKRILIDCGLFQGVKKLRTLNWEDLPVPSSQLDLVLLTHGHLDHTGFLPRLVRRGYGGPVWGTSPTLDIAEVILRDSAKIQEEDADRANEAGFTRHQPALPLYTTDDVEHTLPLFEIQEEGKWIDIDPDLRIRFEYSGHILGATFIEMDVPGQRIVFSGDVGRPVDPLLRAPKKPNKADVLLIESTYGDRFHPDEDIMERIKQVVNDTVQRQGTVIIPSFAVERTQLLMYLLWQLDRRGELPSSLPIIMDSPMGANVLELFHKHHDWHTLSSEECAEMCYRIRVVQSYRETWDIIDDPRPKVVIAGSGMVTGGRVLTYLQQYIARPETTVMLAGYQAEGTRGRQLLQGAGELKFYGKYHPVRARVEYLEGLSGHADQRELLDWLAEITEKPERVFIVHGEAQASDTLRVKLKDVFDWQSEIPELYDIATLPL
ncbi:MBL fold metallo-hydrolase RNA specificity domain-containing protein [Fodinibius sediminis]|uniref:Metallo-beta-lactamase family protein n=1 Tax=Fodinibius sediminis TaxID=1214077 RepID=A0A521CM76_9BACT|nr:MBL fold metallo-hydrolase [Fodinibius sediminis]SMO60465.1 metallo-beta-lactamase family protein [Fodinibius sediminis]